MGIRRGGAIAKAPGRSAQLRIAEGSVSVPSRREYEGNFRAKATSAALIRNAHNGVLEKQCAASGLRFQAGHRKPNLLDRRHPDHRAPRPFTRGAALLRADVVIE